MMALLVTNSFSMVPTKVASQRISPFVALIRTNWFLNPENNAPKAVGLKLTMMISFLLASYTYFPTPPLKRLVSQIFSPVLAFTKITEFFCEIKNESSSLIYFTVSNSPSSVPSSALVPFGIKFWYNSEFHNSFPVAKSITATRSVPNLRASNKNK